MTVQAGLEGEISEVVTEKMTADAFGNTGVSVLATPYIVWMMEGASVRALEGHLAEGESTVGTRVDVWHECASPLGATISVRSRLTEVEGDHLTFEVEAHDDDGRLAHGRHERHVVDLERFLRGTARRRSG